LQLGTEKKALEKLMQDWEKSAKLKNNWLLFLIRHYSFLIFCGKLSVAYCHIRVIGVIGIFFAFTCFMVFSNKENILILYQLFLK
jgi:hypothetical protein